LTPGLALAVEIQKDEPDSRILFVGSDKPLERRLVAAAGYEHCVLPVESSESLARHPLRFAWRSWRSWREARRLLRERPPAAVIGLGGFASVPAVWAASRTGLRTLILEQNAVPGRATRILAGRAAAVCLAFEEAEAHLKRAVRIALTGNPVRAEIAELARETANRDTASDQAAIPVLLILGGSQGAEGLNDAVCRVVSSAPGELEGWRIVHQTGSAQADQIASTYSERGIDHEVRPFFDDMAARYRRASVVVSRAGATTLAELACAGRPAILVPYPYAADRHQHANARVFARAGAALVVEHQASSEATAEALAAALVGLVRDNEQRATMCAAMRNLARPDAARNVLAVLRSV
jgi:UDP-N-acetylglucosamine--N-acetylmuramyl-(pentapeptide) pyrophosphoryl-undecaprenol N-acetylglucosamine transferase